MLTARANFLSFTVTALLVSRADPASAAELHVPAEYLTIQAAIDVAADGDVIDIAAGTYTESVQWTDKRLRLIGAGSAATIIDPGGFQGLGRCLTLINVPLGARVESLTCQHGVAPPLSHEGGGALVQGGAPAFEDVVFLHNDQSPFVLSGGGMMIRGAEVSLTNCRFENNAVMASGGGLSVESSDLSLRDCTFQGNFAPFGGALSMGGTSMRATGSLFKDNLAELDGGAIYMVTSSTTCTGCDFDHNLTYITGSGGAISGTGDLAVRGSSFTGNHATVAGGAIQLEGDLQVFDSRFDSNSVTLSGGAIDSIGSALIVGSTFDANTAEVQAGAVDVHGDATIRGCLFHDGEVLSGSGGGLVVQGNALIAKSAFVGNRAPLGKGGGLWVTGVGAHAAVLASLFFRNEALSGGGVAVDADASAVLLASILRGNTGGQIDAEGQVIVIHSNLECGFPGAGNVDDYTPSEDDALSALHLHL